MLKSIIESNKKIMAQVEEVWTGVKAKIFIIKAVKSENVWVSGELYDEEGQTVDTSTILIPRVKLEMYYDYVSGMYPKREKLETANLDKLEQCQNCKHWKTKPPMLGMGKCTIAKLNTYHNYWCDKFAFGELWSERDCGKEPLGNGSEEIENAVC